MGKEDYLFHGLGNLGADAIAGEESGANEIGLRGRVGGDIAMENPREAAGFREDRIMAGGASKEPSDDLGSHSSLPISGAGPLSPFLIVS